MKFDLDRQSLLVLAPGDATLGELASFLEADALMPPFDPNAVPREETVDDWIAKGCKSAPSPWLDPADHVIAGIEFELDDGRLVRVRPAPRRSTGPDLVSLVQGAEHRIGRVLRVWLRVDPKAIERPKTAPFRADVDRPESDAERALWDKVRHAIADGAPRRD